MNFTEIEGMPGVTLRKFCGLPVEKVDENTYTMCVNEASGEVMAEVEGSNVSIPVCQPCLEGLMAQYEVEELDTSATTLL